MTEKLLPCPFCGGEAEIFDDMVGIWVSCKVCQSCGIVAEEKETAAAAWNQRINNNWISCEERLPEVTTRFAAMEAEE